jgi:hypothetical protein
LFDLLLLCGEYKDKAAFSPLGIAKHPSLSTEDCNLPSQKIRNLKVREAAKITFLRQRHQIASTFS